MVDLKAEQQAEQQAEQIDDQKIEQKDEPKTEWNTEQKTDQVQGTDCIKAYGDRAKALFEEGYNCAQSVVLAFSEEMGILVLWRRSWKAAGGVRLCERHGNRLWGSGGLCKPECKGGQGRTLCTRTIDCRGL